MRKRSEIFILKNGVLSCLVDVHVAILHTHSAALRFYIILLSYLNRARFAVAYIMHLGITDLNILRDGSRNTVVYTASKYFIVGRKFTVIPHIHKIEHNF